MIINPYNTNGIWLKGNLHTHTEASPCGHYSLEKVIDMYTSYKMEYDFLAITDHYHLTDVSKYKNNDKVIVFTGVEYKYGKLQTLGINLTKYSDNEKEYSNHQEIFDSVTKSGGLNIICHPHAFSDDYWPYEKLLSLNNYQGIEIYNNNVKFDNKGRAVATDLWDKLLSSGKKLWGFANDDMHVFQRCGGAFNVAYCNDKTPEAVISALRHGSFYASTGIFLESISTLDNKIRIELKHSNIPADFTLIGLNGRVLNKCSGTFCEFDYSYNDPYVRIEIKREDGAAAWTQPFWRE